MFTLLLCLLILSAVFGVAFKITGALLKACIWLIILLPCALIFWTLGVVCCCTLLLIPLGIMLFKEGVRIIIPR